jgi:hypothetical protein
MLVGRFMIRNILSTKDVFPILLELEVKRSLRYQDFISLLLIEADLLPTAHARRVPKIDKMISLLGSQLRETDLIGIAEENTITVVLLHSDKQSANKVAKRLTSLMLGYLGLGDGSKSGLSLGIACVPTHAADSKSLLTTAFEMLQQSKAHSGTLVEIAT